MKFVADHHRISPTFHWRELGFRGRRAEIMVLPNFYIRFGAHPRCYELAIDADGWRVFTPTRTVGKLWAWKA